MSDLFLIEKTHGRNGIVVGPRYNMGAYDGVSRGHLAYFWDGKSWIDIRNDPTPFIKEVNSAVEEVGSKLMKDGETVSLRRPQWDDAELKKIKYFMNSFSGNSKAVFDTKVIFDDQPVTRVMYSTTQLDYHPQDIPTPSFDKVMNAWFPDHTELLLWFIGAVLMGRTHQIQKMVFIYGKPKSGKSSFLDILSWIFQGYLHEISINRFTDTSNQFATGEFTPSPILVDRDANISRIKDKVLFNKFISHEPFMVNAKHIPQFESQFDGILFAASNYVFDMGDPSKDGTARRAVSIYSNGAVIPKHEYDELMWKIKTIELPGIAYKAIEVFKRLGANYSDGLTLDTDMLYKSSITYRFIRDAYMDGKIGEVVKLKDVADMYKDFLANDDLSTINARHRIKETMESYYEFASHKRINGKDYRSVFFNPNVPKILGVKEETDVKPLEDKEIKYDSKFNYFAHSTFPGQETNDLGNPKYKWDNVKTTVSDIDQTKLHYMRAPQDLIKVDFDAPTMEENLKLAGPYPPTYGEISKSGKGIHLWYMYTGDDIDTLDHHPHPDIEIKVNTGKSGARRKFTKSNGIEYISKMKPEDLAHKEKKMLQDIENIEFNEKRLRSQIEKSLKKQNTGSTFTEVQFIAHLLDEAQASGEQYDVSDLRQTVMSFAMHSTHQAEGALKTFAKMKWSSAPQEELREINDSHQGFQDIPKEELWMFDIESMQDLFMISYKKYGGETKTYINYDPTGKSLSMDKVNELLAHPLVGFNNLRYDNHIMYGAHLGKSVSEIFEQSTDLVTNGNNNGIYPNAYQLAYADLYDLIPDKKSLKKWEVEMGIKHNELDVDWEATVEENAKRLGMSVQEFIDLTAEYNRDDVDATEKLLDYRWADFEARKMLASLTDKPVSTTTNNLSAAFIFGDDKRPQDKLNWVDLSEEFPGYEYKYDQDKKKMVASYKGVDPSRGGYVYSNPGVYKNVVEVDVSNMHPRSAIAMKYFGPYADRFEELVNVVGLLKHPTEENLEKVSHMLGGALIPYITPGSDIKGLRQSLKIVINAVYGMSSASFDNKFKAAKNKDNVIAKRGALFMINLKEHVESLGYTVIHIKTDSMKIADSNQDIIHDVQDFAKSYGYDMEIAGEYDRIALIDKAQLIAHYKDGDQLAWHAIGKEFAEPYVYKTLFTHETLDESDYLVTKTTKVGPMYLRDDEQGDEFIGKAGSFFPSKTGFDLMWLKDDKFNSVSGTKGYKWRVAEELVKPDIDMAYFDELRDTAINKIKKVGDLNILFPEGVPVQ